MTKSDPITAIGGNWEGKGYELVRYRGSESQALWSAEPVTRGGAVHGPSWAGSGMTGAYTSDNSIELTQNVIQDVYFRGPLDTEDYFNIVQFK